MIVVDTNIISYFYISGDKSLLAEQLFSVDSNWNAPALWRSEFRNVLSLYLRKKLLAIEEILLILQEAEKLLVDNEFDIPSAHVMQLVSSSQCSAYDCEFVALAQHMDVPLVTEDKKLLKVFPDVAKSIERFLA